MIFKTQKIQKLISSILIIGVFMPAVLFLSTPKKVEAFAGVEDTVHDFVVELFTGKSSVTESTSLSIQLKAVAKEVLINTLRGIARRLLQQMTKSTINWVNSGFHGAPLFLENSQSFFKDIAKFEVKNFVDTIGYDPARFPYGKDIALNTIYTFKSSFEQNAQYSLSQLTNDQAYLNNYRANFNIGGWDGLLLHTQYPQNNPIGFNMLATDELARRLEGTVQNNAQKVQKTLDQGLGFLSPETCPSNPSYNNLQNQFNQPSYKPLTWNSPAPIEGPNYVIGDPYENQAEIDNYTKTFNQQDAAARAEWAKTHTCPGGLKTTTPGSSVGAAVNKALGGSQDQTTLAAAMGNSVSAIVDSLINHFLDKGLTALSSKINPPPPTDTWNYNGLSLGTRPVSTSSAWDAGPDEVIVVSDFKQGVGDGIKNTTEEIKLMDNQDALGGRSRNIDCNNTTQMGIIQVLGCIWPQARLLDQCVPGPDIKWDERLKDEGQRNGQKFAGASSDANGDRAALSLVANHSLSYAVSFFEDWIKDKMLLALPDSPHYIETVNSALEPLSQQSSELINARRLKVETLSRLKSIQSGLAIFRTDPAPGSAQEKVLITLYQQYKAIISSISVNETVEETRSELNTAKDKLSDLTKTTNECKQERTAAGWSPADKEGKGEARGPQLQITNSSGFLGHGGTGSTTTVNPTEKEFFCTYPIVGGFSHGEGEFPNNAGWFHTGSGTTTVTLFNAFSNPPRYPEIPIVNADNVLYSWGGISGLKYADVNVNCNTVFRANVLDYKGSVPGLTTVSEAASYGGGGSFGSDSSCIDSGPATPPTLATPTSSWNPPAQTQVPSTIHTDALVDNGWWPHVSADGKYVAYGNYGGSWVTNLQTKKTYDLTNPPGLPSGGRCISGYWIQGSSTISQWCEIPSSTDTFNRYEWTYNSSQDGWTSKLTNDNPQLVAGNWFGADQGHWFSELAGKRIVLDNKVLASLPPPQSSKDPNDPAGSAGIGAAISQDGNDIVHACNNTNEEICVWNGIDLKHIYPVQTPLYGTATKNGYILYGFNGPLHGITPNGDDVDLTVAPNRFEQNGKLFMVNGQLWVASSGYSNLGTDNERGYVYLRPWGSHQAIAVAADVGRDNLSVAVSGSNFVIATTEVVRGTLTVVTIPINSPRGDLGTSTCTVGATSFDNGDGSTNTDDEVPPFEDTSTSTSDNTNLYGGGGPDFSQNNTPTPSATSSGSTNTTSTYNSSNSSSFSTNPTVQRNFTVIPSSSSSSSGNSSTNYNNTVTQTPTPNPTSNGDIYETNGTFTPTPTPSVTPSGESAPGSINNVTDTQTTIQPVKKSGIMKWIIIGGIMFLLAILFLVWRRRRSNDH